MKAKLILISLLATSSYAVVPASVKGKIHDDKCRKIEMLYNETIEGAGYAGYFDIIAQMPIKIREKQFTKMMDSMLDSFIRRGKIESVQHIAINDRGQITETNRGQNTTEYSYRLWTGEITWNKLAAAYGECVVSYQ